MMGDAFLDFNASTETIFPFSTESILEIHVCLSKNRKIQHESHAKIAAKTVNKLCARTFQEMTQIDAKKRRLNDFINSWSECCICGERGSLGMTNVFNLSLRENEILVKPFVEILEFSLGLKVRKQKKNC